MKRSLEERFGAAHVQAHGGYLNGDALVACSISAHCVAGPHRHHIWIDANGMARGTLGLNVVVFRNSTLRNGEPGYFNTRQLDPARGEGKLIFEHLMAAVPALLPAAIEARRRELIDERTAREVEAELRERMARLHAAAPALLVALQAVTNDYCDWAGPGCEDRPAVIAARAALAKATVA